MATQTHQVHHYEDMSTHELQQAHTWRSVAEWDLTGQGETL